MSLKILFLTHKFYPDVGGIEVNSEILATAFHNAGHDVHLLTWSIDTAQRTFPFTVKRNPDMLELVQQHLWADIVYHNNPCLRLAWPSLFVRKPTVIALCTWVNRTNGDVQWQDKLKLNYLKRAETVIAISEAVRRKCWPGAMVIPNPYRADVFRVDPGVEQRAGFVFLGRLVSDKGADMAIRAIHQILASDVSARLYDRETFSLTIIGDGPDHNNLCQLVDRLGLNSRIRFAGILRGQFLVECLNRHKYILIPSVWEEPFGNVALEGMACGCIPIVSDGGGLPEAIGNAGLVFSRGNVDSLTHTILRLLNNESLQERLLRAAAYQLEVHHPKLITKKYLQVIEGAKVHV